MHLGIYAVNIASGGGVTHLKFLVEELFAEWPGGVGHVRVFCRSSVMHQIRWPANVSVVCRRVYDNGLTAMTIGALARLDPLIRDCDIVLNVGPAICLSGRPLVSMCRNMLPFEWRQLKRFGISKYLWKMLMLRCAHAFIFWTSDGVIFLSEYARNRVSKIVGIRRSKTAIIPHGIGAAFTTAGIHNGRGKSFSDGICKFLYVSRVDVYKNQLSVMRAVAALRKEGYDVHLSILGPSSPGSRQPFEALRFALDPGELFISYLGEIPHESLPKYLANADVFVFASSCENFPNILVEAMAARMPIACSNCEPMPEIAGNGALYFDPEDSSSIRDTLKVILLNEEVRERIADEAFQLSRHFTWRRTLRETISYVQTVFGRTGYS
jgi:glycosyltransferase involved in cell wall biosynthesis